MRATTPCTTEFMINVGRPDITNDDDRKFWSSFHNLVETFHGNITVNGAYDFVCSVLESKGGYLGGGFAYCFWFETLEEKEAFEKAMKLL